MTSKTVAHVLSDEELILLGKILEEIRRLETSDPTRHPFTEMKKLLDELLGIDAEESAPTSEGDPEQSVSEAPDNSSTAYDASNVYDQFEKNLPRY
jgi:hypothetical protein